MSTEVFVALVTLLACLVLNLLVLRRNRNRLGDRPPVRPKTTLRRPEGPQPTAADLLRERYGDRRPPRRGLPGAALVSMVLLAALIYLLLR